MGEGLETKKPPSFSAIALGTAPIRSMEIVRYSKGDPVPFPVVYRTEPGKRAASFTFTGSSFSQDSLYYLRLIQEDGEMAWSSPLYISYR